MSATPAHELILAQSDEERQQCIDVRIEVFCAEQGFSVDDEIDKLDQDPSAKHILLRVKPSLEPVGTIRCSYHPDKGTFKLSRLAVLKDFRQFKFGRELVLKLHDVAQETARLTGQTKMSIVTHSQLPVVPFYTRYGYKPEGEHFDEDGAPHQKMVCQISFD